MSSSLCKALHSQLLSLVAAMQRAFAIRSVFYSLLLGSDAVLLIPRMIFRRPDIVYQASDINFQ
jgi:hypothetical protein